MNTNSLPPRNRKIIKTINESFGNQKTTCLHPENQSSPNERIKEIHRIPLEYERKLQRNN